MYITFGEEATSGLAGFYTGPLSWSNWDLEMLVFQGGGKPENPEKNSQSKARTNNKLNPHVAPGRNRTRATLVQFAFLSRLEGSTSRMVRVNDRG